LTRIYLIRHAEAEGNIYRRAHGHYNGEIIGRGYLQLGQLCKRFEHERLDAVYSSDLIRARVTAEAVSESQGLPLKTSEQLREINIGVWEDTPWGNLEHHQAEMTRNFTRDPARWSVDGSEEYKHVQSRMTEYITDIARRHEGGAVAAFSHGFAIRAFLCGIMGVPSHEVITVPYCDNTAVALLLYDKGGLSIEYHGDNSHLSSEISTFAHQT